MATPTVFEPKRLWASSQVPAADTLIYTAPAAEDGVRIHGLILVNTSATPITMRVTLGAMAVANAICWDFSVPADGLPYDLVEGKKTIILNPSDVIRAQASAANSVTIHGFGIEMD